MADTGTLGQPLLQGSDVETGRTEPTKEENAELLKEGQMSWEELIAFFSDPSHWTVTVLVTYALFCILGMCYLFIEKENFDINHNIGLVTFLAVAGLSAAAYNAFLAEQLKEEVNRYWRNNQQLKSNKVRLEKTCETLRVNVGKMREEVDDFQKLKGKMKQFADEQGEGFSKVFDKASGVLDHMRDQLMASQSNLLTGYSFKMEFLDGEEGMTEEEFAGFAARLPKEFQDSVSFSDISGGNSTASSEQVQELIDRVVKSLGPDAR